METALVVVLLMAFIAAVFFWRRGMIRPSQSDLTVGFLVIVATCAGLAIAHFSLSLIGLVIFGFGVATLVLNRWAKASCSLSRIGRISFGSLAVISGLFLQIIL